MGGGETDPRRALDCGAGIGRITKRLLLPIFKEVDMVELNQKCLDQAPGFIRRIILSEESILFRVTRFHAKGETL